MIDSLLNRFRVVRTRSEQLCRPLEPEDYQLQSMPDCSPPKWHLAHTTWFFETFVLSEYVPNHRPFHPLFRSLFNSYYDAVGDRWSRPQRGLLSRPTVAEVYRYRHAVDEQMYALLARLENTDPATRARLGPLVELGTHHEEQHQELLLTDLKHAFGLNPLRPSYAPSHPEPPTSEVAAVSWQSFPAGVREIGHDGCGFAFDNEGPRHRVFLHSFALASRPVTVGEYLAFMADGGYQRPEHWLSDGWAARQRLGWTAPLYWQCEGSASDSHSGDDWSLFTLRGQRPLNLAEPVCHVSFYEADAYARWAGARLPTEAEWETALTTTSNFFHGNFLESGFLHPCIRVSSVWGTCGFGPAARISPIRATDPIPVHCANTTPNSCVIRWCSGAVRA